MGSIPGATPWRSTNKSSSMRDLKPVGWDCKKVTICKKSDKTPKMATQLKYTLHDKCALVF